MALITCKECKNQVSDKAEKCPSCGAKVPKKTSATTWVVAILFGFILISAISNKSKNGASSESAPTLTPKEEAIANIVLEGKWRKEGFGNVMEADFVVKNKSKYDVKDIEIECVHSANSGTNIDSNKRVAYEIFKAHKEKKLKKFNMGFIHSQASSTTCSITDLVVING